MTVDDSVANRPTGRQRWRRPPAYGSTAPVTEATAAQGANLVLAAGERHTAGLNPGKHTVSGSLD